MTEQEIESSEWSKAVINVTEYLEKITELTICEYGKFAFRGQGDISHPISSTAARRLGYNQLGEDALKKFNDYNCDLISNAKLKGYDKKGNIPLEDLELLAELQHNGAATALIDFTYSSLVALYFASINDPDNDGVVHIINTSEPEKFKPINGDNSGWKFKKYLEEMGDFLWVWEPSDLNNRIPKQHSLFIFGKPEIIDESIEKVRISADQKSKILFELRDLHDISGLTLFNDMVGFASENSCEKPYYSKEYLEQMNKAKSMYVTEQSSLEEILEYVERALKINPISYEALIYCANIKDCLEDYQGVIEICDRIIDIEPDSATALILRAKAYTEMRQFDDAINDLSRSLAIRKDNPYAAFLLSQLKGKKKLEDLAHK
ncbi:FRG domain-containing protein [Methanogenium cariaci]